MLKFYVALLLSCCLCLTACTSKEAEPLTQRQLRSLMLESLSHSAESWWYLGSDKEKHYISIERPGNSALYSLLISQVNIKLKMIEYPNKNKHRIKLKKTNIKFIK